MKNPANPGDFGTNGTRGVVLSGMSETTKRAMLLSPLDNPSWRSATNAERTEWFRLHTNAAPRPSTFAADGGAERATTNFTSGNWSGLYGSENRSCVVVRSAFYAGYGSRAFVRVGG